MRYGHVSRRWKSTGFVAVQFLCLGYIFISGPFLAGSLPLVAIELIGLSLGGWAVLAMGFGNFQITPDPLSGSKMVIKGPYRIVRHPMYLALLVTTLPLLLDSFDLFRLAAWLILLITLLLKMRYEEGLLRERYSAYQAYMRSTARLIPCLY